MIASIDLTIEKGEYKLKKKVVSGMMLTLLFIGMLTFGIRLVVASELTVHNIDSGEDFATIQEAIDDSDTLDGHTVFVEEGSYYENVVVDKTLTLVGENRNNTIIDGSYGTQKWESVVQVSANNTKITGFTIQNDAHGIEMNGCNNTIVGNTVTNIGLVKSSFHAIAVKGQFNVISHNTVSNSSTLTAIEVRWGSEFSVISDNKISNTDNGGIEVAGSNNSVICNNAINNARGIWVSSSNNTAISHNMLTSVRNGIDLSDSYNSSISNNVVMFASRGIVLGAYSQYNTINDNIVLNALRGILLDPYYHVYFPQVWPPPHRPPIPTFNNVIGNTIMDGFHEGLVLRNSYQNFIVHNNFVNNTRQVSTELWDYEDPGYYPSVWHDGYPSGGNYWSNYTGVDLYSGPDQNQIGSDGIGDNFHFIGKFPESGTWFLEHIDDYPLMEPWSEATRIKTLIRTVRFWSLHKGTENSLTSKLKGALRHLDMGKETGATHKMMTFINHVDVLRGKKLAIDHADYLTSEAQRIIDLINE